MDVGEVQTGVGVAADDNGLSPACHGTAQGIAAGGGKAILGAFLVVRRKIRHGKAAVVGIAFVYAVNFVVAAVAGGSGGNGGGHLNTGER